MDPLKHRHARHTFLLKGDEAAFKKTSLFVVYLRGTSLKETLTCITGQSSLK